MFLASGAELPRRVPAAASRCAGEAGLHFDLGAAGIARCPSLHGCEDWVLSSLFVVAERTFSVVSPGLRLGELSGASLRALP